jgi:hypothetical protein
MSKKKTIEWHDVYCPETDIRLRLGPDVIAHFGLEQLKQKAPELKQALDALPYRKGNHLKKTLHGMMGGMEIICYAHPLQEAGQEVKVYYVDSMARFKQYNFGEQN